MRRKDREITSIEKLILIMKTCDVCRVAFHDEKFPYIIPMNFGFDVVDEKINLYFHGAKAGKKLDLLHQNPHVGFEMDTNHEFVYSDKQACDWTMKYVSIIGNGIITIVSEEEKRTSLCKILDQYHKEETYNIHEEMLKNTTVLKLEVISMSGKAR